MVTWAPFAVLDEDGDGDDDKLSRSFAFTEATAHGRGHSTCLSNAVSKSGCGDLGKRLLGSLTSHGTRGLPVAWPECTGNATGHTARMLVRHGTVMLLLAASCGSWLGELSSAAQFLGTGRKHGAYQATRGPAKKEGLAFRV